MKAPSLRALVATIAVSAALTGCSATTWEEDQSVPIIASPLTEDIGRADPLTHGTLVLKDHCLLVHHVGDDGQQKLSIPVFASNAKLVKERSSGERAVEVGKNRIRIGHEFVSGGYATAIEDSTKKKLTGTPCSERSDVTSQVILYDDIAEKK